jgi:hypothetical protein
MVWEFFHVKVPYADTRMDQMSVARAVATKGIRPTFDSATVCPAEVASFIKKCWDATPANRPTFSKVGAFAFVFGVCVCVCVCVCLDLFIFVCECGHVWFKHVSYISAHACFSIFVKRFVCVAVCVCTCTCMHLHVYARAHVYKQADIETSKQTVDMLCMHLCISTCIFCCIDPLPTMLTCTNTCKHVFARSYSHIHSSHIPPAAYLVA